MEQEQPPRSNKGGKFFYSKNCVFDIVYPKGKPYLLSVYFYLCRRANNKTQECWPSQKTISEHTGMSERKVKTVIKDLEQLKLIVIQRKSYGGATHNFYYLTDDSVWRMQSAPYAPTSALQALRVVNPVPPNKTHRNKTNKNNLVPKNKPQHFQKKSYSRNEKLVGINEVIEEMRGKWGTKARSP